MTGGAGGGSVCASIGGSGDTKDAILSGARDVWGSVDLRVVYVGVGGYDDRDSLLE